MQEQTMSFTFQNVFDNIQTYKIKYVQKMNFFTSYIFECNLIIYLLYMTKKTVRKKK